MSSEDCKNMGEVPAVPLFQTSRTGFNDRAWNDPPPGLMNANMTGVTPTAVSSRPKLTGRVAFPLNSSPAVPNVQAPTASTILNPTGPPPTSGFVPQQQPPPPSQ